MSYRSSFLPMRHNDDANAILLLDDDEPAASSNRSARSYNVVANQTTPVQMAFLRRVYLYLAVQFFLMGGVCVAISVFVPPVGRIWMVEAPYYYWLYAIFVGLVAAWILLKRYPTRAPVNGLAFAAFATLLALSPTALFMAESYEVPYTSSLMVSIVMSGHFLFCAQNLKPLKFVHSFVATLVIVPLAGYFIEVLLMLYGFDFFWNVVLALSVSTYLHAAVHVSMQCYTPKQSHLACIHLYTAIVQNVVRIKGLLLSN